ncbi:prolyl aminopeptidase [Brevundimonas sp. NPDC092305]|uniref:prolyl aminopeptidase n=1 Tax=Brevundimonas sp. NPDC092305 TaxID=3363957 RepID=UPI0038113641
MAFPAPDAPRRELYPEIEPFAHGMMPTEGEHQIYYEECGNPQGTPVLVVHGGPGGAVNPGMRRYFDPAKYRIVLFDQRGCGNSTPNASLDENTTWRLIEDMERLRERLGIDRWVVFGGSWGSTLSMAYAIKHPDRVGALILRGIFLLTRHELRWFYQEGASNIFPDAWERFVEPIPEAERGDLMAAYYKRLTGDDRAERERCAVAWSSWEGETVSVEGPDARPDKFAEPDFAVAFARIENWYFTNNGFFPEEGWLLNNLDKIRHIPCWIAQGRFDVVTPLSSCWALHRAWPEAKLEIVKDAGHASSEPGIIDSLVRGTDWAATL